jgi:molybdopterin molybdotransferase
VLPAVLDTVVPWEDVAREGDALVLTRGARSGQHVRRAGEDARRGSPALTAGTRLSSRHLALLATLERDRALVAARPRVAVVCTGDELRDPGTPARPGSIVDSNGPMLAGFVRQAGGSPSVHRVPDREGALEQALAALRADHDAIVTVGGAAEGKHDHVVPALERLGGALVFRGVSIKPGKPVALATLGALPVLAMPGNPGSAFVTFALLGLPLLRAMQGDRAPRAALARAPLAGAVRGAADRDVIVYGALRDCAFHPGGAAPSGSIPGLAGASALARIPAGTSLREGDAVETIDVERA